MAKILITGAQGFLGQSLVYLAGSRGLDVWRLGRSCKGHKDIQCDIRVPGSWQSAVASECFDAVFHLAGATRVGQGDDPYGVNVNGTKNLISAICRQPTWLLVASSSGVYGAVGEDHFPIDEECPTSPEGLYAKSKLKQEQVALNAEISHKGLKVCVARLANLVGPGQGKDYVFGKIIGEVASRAQRGTKVMSVNVGSLEVTRDFVDTRDSSEALLRLYSATARGIFNVAAGKEIHLRDTMMTFLKTIPENVTLIEQPGRFESKLKRQVLSNRKLLEATGWEPQRAIEISLTDMLSQAREAASQPTPVSGALIT